jgi:hypothetical protein
MAVEPGDVARTRRRANGVRDAAERSRLAGLALRPEFRPKPEGHQRALAREAMSLGEQSFDLQGQLPA